MNQASCPPAPWHLQGDAIALLEPRGVRLLVHYTHSPVGAYDECALVQIHSFDALQVLAGQNMRVPMKIRARARLAWRGRQCGVLLENFDFEVAAPQPL